MNHLGKWSRWCLLLAGCALLALQTADAAPRYRALLVGVSEYPTLAANKSLKGPRNDVMRMRQVLQRRGVPADAIVVLTESGDPSLLPTRARILRELQLLARTARDGDYIIIMMAGHGSQAPVPRNSPFHEPDGHFEIFLPRDVGDWNGGRGDVLNAIKDHEIRALVDEMTAQGAFVWAIFDACHSATLVRGGGVTSRHVSPADLKIPRSVQLDAERRAAASHDVHDEPTAPMA